MYYSSQVETQDQGMTYPVLVRCIATYLRICKISPCRCSSATVGRNKSFKPWFLASRGAQPTALCDPRQHDLLLSCRNWRCPTRKLVLPQWNRSPTWQYRMAVLQYQGTWSGTSEPSYWWCVRDLPLWDTWPERSQPDYLCWTVHYY